MVVGCLGDIVFSVSSDTVKTLQNFKFSSTAKYATHQLNGGAEIVEFTGTEAGKISFNMQLSSYLGASPTSMIQRLSDYEQKGATLPFVLGNFSYGRYRWVVQSHDVTAKTTDPYGNITTATVRVSLLEYVR